MTNFLQHIVETCCKIHFKTINPKKVRFRFAKAKENKRVLRISSIKHGSVVINIDKKYADNADESDITVKVAHELAHVKLKHPLEPSLEDEKEAEKEVKKFFRKWIAR